MVTGVPEFMKPDIHPNVEAGSRVSSTATSRTGYARYDSRAELSPMHQEIWAHKTCDHMSVINTGLAMIEGICGRDGELRRRPHYLTNLVMFSKDKFRLDMIGMYLGATNPATSICSASPRSAA